MFSNQSNCSQTALFSAPLSAFLKIKDLPKLIIFYTDDATVYRCLSENQDDRNVEADLSTEKL